jgi:hypothetical protein
MYHLGQNDVRRDLFSPTEHFGARIPPYLMSVLNTRSKRGSDLPERQQDRSSTSLAALFTSQRLLAPV